MTMYQINIGLGKDFENNILLRSLLLIARNSAAKLWMIDEMRVEKSYMKYKLKKNYIYEAALSGKSSKENIVA